MIPKRKRFNCKKIKIEAFPDSYDIRKYNADNYNALSESVDTWIDKLEFFERNYNSKGELKDPVEPVGVYEKYLSFGSNYCPVCCYNEARCRYCPIYQLSGIKCTDGSTDSCTDSKSPYIKCIEAMNKFEVENRSWYSSKKIPTKKEMLEKFANVIDWLMEVRDHCIFIEELNYDNKN